jgi:hypothetical protein
MEQATEPSRASSHLGYHFTFNKEGPRWGTPTSTYARFKPWTLNSGVVRAYIPHTYDLRQTIEFSFGHSDSNTLNVMIL